MVAIIFAKKLVSQTALDPMNGAGLEAPVQLLPGLSFPIYMVPMMLPRSPAGRHSPIATSLALIIALSDFWRWPSLSFSLSKSQNQTLIQVLEPQREHLKNPHLSPSSDSHFVPCKNLQSPLLKFTCCWTHQAESPLAFLISFLALPGLRQIMGIREHPINGPFSLVCCCPELSFAQTIAPSS